MCKCAYCNKEEKNVYICNRCDKVFCQDCFENKYGDVAFSDMVWNEGYVEGVLCPDCYGEMWTKIRAFAQDFIHWQ